MSDDELNEIDAIEDLSQTEHDQDWLTDATPQQEATDSSPEARLEQAGSQIAQIPELDVVEWVGLDQVERAHALERAGEVLAEIYDVPLPPLFISELAPNVRGAYDTAEYTISMNATYEHLGEALFGDDPDEALRTYAHEFWHSYQDQQVTMFKNPHFWGGINDLDQARQWATEWEHPLNPDVAYTAYRQQSIEHDARAFADALVGAKNRSSL